MTVAVPSTLIDVVLMGSLLPQMDCIVNAGWTAHSPFLARAIDAAGYVRNDGGSQIVEALRLHRRMERRTALFLAFQKGLSTTRTVPPNGGAAPPVTLRVQPSVEDGEVGRYALVVFEEEETKAPDAEDAGEPRAAPDEPEGARHARAMGGLEAELRRSREQLEHVCTERDRTVEELQSANEELRSINEEQRAAAEELETSREEIHSVNEELTTINQEHQSTIEELRRTNADLQNLIESTEIGTIFLDRSLRVRRFTPAAAALFNFVAADRGRPLAHITHRLDYPALVDDARGVLDSLERVEREARSDDGAWYIVRIGPYRSPDDGIDGAVLTFFDITARKRVEEELREAKILAESANLAKGTFLATLSHEFRTPLTGMLMYVDLLRIGGGLNAEQELQIGHIMAGGWHLTSMIDEILAFASPDGEWEPVRSARVDAREITREAAVLVEAMVKAKALALVLELPDEPAWLETDGAKARQILVNLCGNAARYTERGEIGLSVRAGEGRVVFEVRDTGVGIAAEHQGRIFDRFWQVDGAAPRSVGGMGIGRAAAREFSRMLGGDVEVESEVGRGSTFRVWLPRTQGGG